MKVSYHKRFSDDFTVYDQAVSMTTSEALHLQHLILDERRNGFPRVKEYCPEGKNYAELFLKRLSTKDLRKNKVSYLTLTQRRFMELFLLSDVKGKVKDRNTCILINK